MSGGLWDDPDAAIARVEDQIRAAQHQAAVARELESSMRAIVGRAGSPDRTVTAAVSASGIVTDLSLKEDALHQSASALARVIRDTINAAHRDVGAQAVALSEEAFGEESPVTARLREEAQARSSDPGQSGITY